MTIRYNPQSIEKQVRKWPVLFSEQEFHKDICLRVNQLLDKIPNGHVNPFSVNYEFEEEILSEYGVDACRIAILSNQSTNNPDSLLESSFKWLARLHDALLTTSKEEFNPVPWLEALIKYEDYVIKRKADNLALSLAKKAVKDSPLNSSLTEREKLLAASVLYPFVPVFTEIKLLNSSTLTISHLQNLYPEYIFKKIAMEKGGWHWHVFLRKIYIENPMAEIQKIKWIKKALDKNKAVLKEDDGGIRICLS